VGWRSEAPDKMSPWFCVKLCSLSWTLKCDLPKKACWGCFSYCSCAWVSCVHIWLPLDVEGVLGWVPFEPALGVHLASCSLGTSRRLSTDLFQLFPALLPPTPRACPAHCIGSNSNLSYSKMDRLLSRVTVPWGLADVASSAQDTLLTLTLPC
jgi:hypothetical protein